MAPIDNGEGEHRILISFDFLDTLTCAELYDARIDLPLSGFTTSATLEFRVLTAVWSKETVAWTGGWEEAGSDFDKNRMKRLRVPARHAGKRSWSLPVTTWVRGFVHDPSSNHGILILPPEQEEEGYDSAWKDVIRQSGLSLVLECSGKQEANQ